MLTWQLAAQPERADRRGQTDEVETAGRSTSGATSAPFLLGPPQALAESRRSSWARNAVPGHESSLDSYGWTMLKTLLTANECATIAGLYEDDHRFRSMSSWRATVSGEANTSTSRIRCRTSSPSFARHYIRGSRLDAPQRYGQLRVDDGAPSGQGGHMRRA